MYENEMERSDIELNKYYETINKFSALPPDKDISSAVKSLLDVHFKDNFTSNVLKIIHGCIDLTTLTSLDTKESVWSIQP